MLNFPPHKASLTLSHNDHLDYHLTAEEEITESATPGRYDDDNWVSLEEKQKAIDTNEIWTLQWYPDTPISFYTRHASTLEALMASFEENPTRVEG